MKLYIKKVQLITTFFFLGLLFIQASNFDDEFNNDLQAINASVLHPTSGKAHFFVGQFFHQYNPVTDKLDKMGRIGKDGWYGVTKNVNAVLIHPQNKKAYFFTGNTYQRYDFSKKKVDKTGVTGQDGWTGIEGPIDAVIMHPTNNCAYFFKGKKYYRFSFAKDKMDKIGTIGVGGWKGLPANIDSAIMHPNGKAYFFARDKYYRYDFRRDAADKTGIIARDGWKGLFHKIDGVVRNGTEVHFIKGAYKKIVKEYNSNYLARKITEIDNNNKKNNHNNTGFYTKRLKELALNFSPNTPRTYNKRLGYEAYKGVPKNIDAVIEHPSNKKYYFFKGSKYYRYDTSKQVVDKTGTIGKDGWKGIPTNIDAATIWYKTVYFFKGAKYYAYDTTSSRIKATGNIRDKFKGVPDYIDAAHSFAFTYRAYKTKDGKTKKWIRHKIMFVKKDLVYTYSELKRNVVSWDLLDQGLFK
ncbi:hypothetical protein FBALC1_15652 [Flavobacteriales bacterium ALC-1]|nr:hypothetical protein FBALC1_15652 [Flavobacteriales bacterium ALC-1]